MQDELTKLRREMLRRQTSSFRDTRSPMQAADRNSQYAFDKSATRDRQEQDGRQLKEMQHWQQEVARLRQERDAARMQSNGSTAKQPLNRRPGGGSFLG